MTDIVKTLLGVATDPIQVLVGRKSYFVVDMG
jgi:hypothetical protein